MTSGTPEEHDSLVPYDTDMRHFQDVSLATAET
jgi:hypothetical protein